MNDGALKAYGQLQFHRALEDIFIFIRAINKFLEIRAPWKQPPNQSIPYSGIDYPLS
jgi:methionyl-tRNA synthetase